jgi:hypothetical protein
MWASVRSSEAEAKIRTIVMGTPHREDAIER